MKLSEKILTTLVSILVIAIIVRLCLDMRGMFYKEDYKPPREECVNCKLPWDIVDRVKIKWSDKFIYFPICTGCLETLDAAAIKQYNKDYELTYKHQEPVTQKRMQELVTGIIDRVKERK